jgi:hypothetical protein
MEYPGRISGRPIHNPILNGIGINLSNSDGPGVIAAAIPRSVASVHLIAASLGHRCNGVILVCMWLRHRIWDLLWEVDIPNKFSGSYSQYLVKFSQKFFP